jgi:hypothetical protein
LRGRLLACSGVTQFLNATDEKHPDGIYQPTAQ